VIVGRLPQPMAPRCRVGMLRLAVIIAIAVLNAGQRIVGDAEVQQRIGSLFDQFIGLPAGEIAIVVVDECDELDRARSLRAIGRRGFVVEIGSCRCVDCMCPSRRSNSSSSGASTTKLGHHSIEHWSKSLVQRQHLPTFADVLAVLGRLVVVQASQIVGYRHADCMERGEEDLEQDRLVGSEGQRGPGALGQVSHLAISR